MTLTFASSVEAAEWQDKTTRIKNCIDAINYSAAGSEESVTMQRLDLWLEMVHQYAGIYGKHCVPVDIRKACNQVQGFRNVPKTDFGEEDQEED